MCPQMFFKIKRANRTPALIARMQILIELMGSVHNVRKLRYIHDLYVRFNRRRMLMQPLHTRRMLHLRSFSNTARKTGSGAKRSIRQYRALIQPALPLASSVAALERKLNLLTLQEPAQLVEYAITTRSA